MVGLNALKAFIKAKRARPFLYADLKRVMEGAEIARITNAQEGEEERTSGLGHATLSPQREPANKCLAWEDCGSKSNSSTKKKLCFINKIYKMGTTKQCIFSLFFNFNFKEKDGESIRGREWAEEKRDQALLCLKL